MRKPRLFEPEVPIPEEIREAVDAWLAYKAKRRESYKTAEGLADLVERMAEMGPERAMAAVKWSRSNNYKGLYEEKKNGNGNGGPRDAPPVWAVPYLRDRELQDWPFLDKSTQQCILENISLGHPTRYR